MPKVRIRIAASALIFIALTLLVYQNCMPLSEKALEEEDSVATPYPWDVRVDTVGLMTCNRMGENNPENYFTFRVGALQGTAGIGSTTEFHDWARQNNFGTLAKKEQLIASEAAFADTLVQTAVRDITDMRILLPQGKFNTRSDDVSRLWSPNSMAGLAHTVLGLPSGSRMNISPVGQRFLGQVSFVEGRDYASQIIPSLTGNAYVTVGFQNAGDVTREEGLLFYPLQAQGMGFQMSMYAPWNVPFSGGNAVQFGYHGSKVLKQIYPSYLKAPGRYTGEELACPKGAEFRIIPSRDTPLSGLVAGCQVNGESPANLTGEARKIYDAADLLLNGAVTTGVKAWNIDVTNRCITRNITRPGGIADEGSGGSGPYSNCYANGRSVEYSNDPSISCCSLGTSCPAGQKVCVEYFSLCATYLAP